MKTQVEQQQDAQNAQTSVREMVVAAGLLTVEEAAAWITVTAESREHVAHLPAGAVPTECSGCGCDLHDSTILKLGFDYMMGMDKVHAIIAVLEQGSTEN